MNNDFIKFLFKYSFVNTKDLLLDVPMDFSSMALSIIWKDSIEAYEEFDLTWGGEGIISEITGIKDKEKLHKFFLKATGK